ADAGGARRLLRRALRHGHDCRRKGRPGRLPQRAVAPAARSTQLFQANADNVCGGRMHTSASRCAALAVWALAVIPAACGGSQPCDSAPCAADAAMGPDDVASPDLAPLCRDDGYDCTSDAVCCGNVCGGGFCASSDEACAI